MQNWFQLLALNEHVSDEGLEKEWMEGTYAGTTELKKYIYLTTLLKVKKDVRLPTIIEELMVFSKGKSYEATAKEHIRELETYA
jgi:hypothetical protein